MEVNQVADKIAERNTNGSSQFDIHLSRFLNPIQTLSGQPSCPFILRVDGDRDSATDTESAGHFTLDRIERLDQIIEDEIGHMLMKVAFVPEGPQI